jgi:hypothetical protein
VDVGHADPGGRLPAERGQPGPGAGDQDGAEVDRVEELAQLVVARDREPLLLSLAAQLEAALGWPERRPEMAR